MMMFSLAGIPPLAGFWGKLSLFTGSVSVSLTAESSSVQTWFVVLAVAGAINAAIAAAYYLRVVGVMYFRAPGQRGPQCEGGAGAGASVAVCAALVALLGFAPGLLLGPASFTTPQQPIERQANRASQESPALEARGSNRASQESPALEARQANRADADVLVGIDDGVSRSSNKLARGK